MPELELLTAAAGVHARPLALCGLTRAGTYDAEKRTVRVRAATTAAAVRVPWFEEPFIEVLDMAPGSVRLGRFNSGRAPVLDHHRQWSVRTDQVGSISKDSAVLDPSGALDVEFRLSKRADLEGLRTDVADGIVSNTSIGYKVYTYREETMPGDKMRRLRAVDWEPFEASFVTVPADADSGTRGLYLQDQPELAQVRAGELEYLCNLAAQRAGETPMPEPIATPPVTGLPPAARSEITPPTPPPAPPVAAVAVDSGAILRTERERCRAIDQAVRSAALGEEFARELRDAGVTVDEARSRVLENLAARSGATPTPPASIQVTREEGETVARGAESYLLARMGALAFDELDENANRFRGFTLRELAIEYLERRGTPARGLSRNELAARALMGSGDFTALLANVGNKSLRTAYQSVPQTWRALARPSEANDFKPMKRVQLGGGTALKLVAQHGEIESAAITDVAESYSLATYGRKYGFTRQALINDDLSGFSRLTRMFGQRAADKESDIVWALLTANPVMGDGVALFNSAHKNTTTGAFSAAAGVASIGNAYKLMLAQTDPDGNYLTIVPWRVIVPAALATVAYQLFTMLTPATPANANPWSGRLADPIIEPRLDATSAIAFYMAANPAQVDCFEYAYLSGSSGPELRAVENSNVDGTEFIGTHDFGAAVMEYVAFAYSTGA